MKQPQRILIIQTAFIGDVILSTALLEAIHELFPEAELHFLLRKGNEGIFMNHPYLHKVIYWDKKNHKLKGMFSIIKNLRSEKYSMVFNLQRFLSSGIFTVFSGANTSIGFDKNPLSLFFTKSVKHSIGGDNNLHESERNISLLQAISNEKFEKKTKLYPSKEDFAKIEKYQDESYLVIGPASVWFTKQFPKSKWVELLKAMNEPLKIIFTGSSSDKQLAQEIIYESGNKNSVNLCGELSLLESAALMQKSRRVLVNDSAPMHLSSGVNAPTTAIFCSTLPSFGFGPTSEVNSIVQVKNDLKCRPCGLHGNKICPQKHFDCALKIDIKDILNTI